jgi:hypothetical protein
MRMMTRVLTLGALIVGFAAPAMALDAGEADRIVRLMETLSEELGIEIYYGAGDVFFEEDQGGAIAAAGFSEARWSSGFNEVVAGYLASLSQEEFDAMFSEAMDLLEASELDEEQKAAIRADMEAHIADAYERRRDGAVHAHAVSGLTDRLHRLMFEE